MHLTPIESPGNFKVKGEAQGNRYHFISRGCGKRPWEYRADVACRLKRRDDNNVAAGQRPRGNLGARAIIPPLPMMLTRCVRDESTSSTWLVVSVCPTWSVRGPTKFGNARGTYSCCRRDRQNGRARLTSVASSFLQTHSGVHRVHWIPTTAQESKSQLEANDAPPRHQGL